MIRRMKDETDLPVSKIHEILNSRNITAGRIELYRKNDRLTDYLVDGRYIFRISESALDISIKLDRVKSNRLVPKTHASGSFSALGRNYFYVITDYIQGSDLYSSLLKLTDEQSIQIGKEISEFLTQLHAAEGTAYDIGHYVPTIPGYKGTWKEGHIEYINWLKNKLPERLSASKVVKIASPAFDYIFANINCLEYQAGPKLLHNDLHPKNIIINQGRLAGIIDWECSQFGEADFELTHLFHWCIYPSKPEYRFEILLKSVFDSFMLTLNVPTIKERLTIYQLEHEVSQLIWNGEKQEDERMQRINGWLYGKIDELFEKWHTA